MPATAQEAADAGAMLGRIELPGASYETEGSDSFATDLVSVGEKSAMNWREVPQSTTVVTREQIAEGGYTALEEALNDAPGLLLLNNDVGRSSIYSRGFEFDYLYFDGLPAPVSSIYGTQPDLAIIDHVEVLKGPSGLFIGTGEPAGSINMRLKQAQAERGGYVTGSVDSNGHARIEGDVTGALNADGSLRGRAVLAYGEGDGFVDKQENGVAVGYGTLAWDVTPDTTLTFSASRMERDIAPFNGLPTYEDGSLLWLDPETTTAADWNDFDNEVTDYTFAVEHRLAGGGRLKFSARQSDQTADFLYAYGGSPANADNEIEGLAYLGRGFDQDALSLDAHAELPFTLGGMNGTALVGVDHQDVSSTVTTARGRLAGTYDLDDWDVSGVARPELDFGPADETEYSATGLYTQMRLDPTADLTVIGGARLTWYEATNSTGGATTGSASEDAHLTPFAGLTYDVSGPVTLYASYSEIFQPQTAVDVNGATLDPVEGRQVELGAKAELGYGLNVSAAYFRLDQVNRPQAVVGENYSVADEEVRAQGIELEAAGEISSVWHVAAGYTYTDTEITEGAAASDVFSTVTPEHMLKLSTVYDVDTGPLAGWSLGGRLRVQSGVSSRGVEAPGYGVVDLSAGREVMGTELRVGVENVFDKDYYSRVGSTALFNFRGAPRTFTASLTRRF
ncbi:TonB-dependent siderophore receptor [Mesobaculum littorinae]|uniref:TonB-dependent siderophore receptor n=2 Tax=Mesobaculum littorinae TaxID=2486419 RepID=A0A438AKF1_9RHOB|nr:TonB-dependent siderophore receptor [Mesobaculum littorinae]